MRFRYARGRALPSIEERVNRPGIGGGHLVIRSRRIARSDPNGGRARHHAPIAARAAPAQARRARTPRERDARLARSTVAPHVSELCTAQ
jgi:hypothetical protein